MKGRQQGGRLSPFWSPRAGTKHSTEPFSPQKYSQEVTLGEPDAGLIQQNLSYEDPTSKYEVSAHKQVRSNLSESLSY